MKICPQCSERYPDVVVQCREDQVDLLQLGEDDDPRFGTTVANRFLVLDTLGEGGMGVVYRAYQTSTAREVALKLLQPQMAQKNTTMGQRFVREARVTAGLSSPHTVTVHDFGVLDSGELFIAMELLKGRPLDKVIQVEGPLPPKRIRPILQHVCLSLDEAHERGLVHRDLKPQNIFIDRLPNGDDFAKVLDFGVAKVLDEHAQQLTKTGAMLGTPGFMAPEQAVAGPIGPGCDLYACGVIMFNMVTRNLPFRGDTAMAVMMSHVMDPPPTLASLGLTNPDYAALDAIIQRCLQKQPEARFASAKALHDALGEVKFGAVSVLAETAEMPPNFETAGSPIAHTVASTRQQLVDQDQATRLAAPASAQPARKSKLPLLVGGGALLVAVGVGLALAFGGGGGPTNEQLTHATPGPDAGKAAQVAPDAGKPAAAPDITFQPPDAHAIPAQPDVSPTPPEADAAAPPVAVDASLRAADPGPSTVATATPDTSTGAVAPLAKADAVQLRVTSPDAGPEPPRHPKPPKPPKPPPEPPGDPQPKPAKGRVLSARVLGDALPKSAAKGALGKLKKKALACYRKATRGGAAPKVTLKLMVRQSGAVSNVGGSPRGDAVASKVAGCFEPTAKATRFPSFEGAAFAVAMIKLGP